jgi:hypothetical protein
MELHITLKHFFAMEQGDSGIIRKLVSIKLTEEQMKEIYKAAKKLYPYHPGEVVTESFLIDSDVFERNMKWLEVADNDTQTT